MSENKPHESKWGGIAVILPPLLVALPFAVVGVTILVALWPIVPVVATAYIALVCMGSVNSQDKAQPKQNQNEPKQ